MFKQRNLLAKIISLLLAVALWFYVTSEQNPKVAQTIQNIPLEIQNLDSGLVVTEMSAQTVSLRVRGRSGILTALDRKSMEAFINLEGLKPGTHKLPVEVTVPTNVEIAEIIPAQVEVTVEPIVHKRLQVQAEVRGNAGEGLAPLPPVLKPDSVLVQGARSLVGKAYSAFVSVDVENASDTFADIVKVKILDITGREIEGLTVRPHEVEAAVQIVPTKTLPVELQLTGSPAPGYALKGAELIPSTVAVKGLPKDLADLIRVRTVPVDLDGATGSFSRKVALNLPSGVYLVDESYPELRVTIQKVQNERVFRDLPVEVRGNNNASVAPARVDLTLTGSNDALSGLTAGELKPFVDASDLSAGEYRIPVQIRLPEGVELKERVTVSVKIGGR